MIPTWFVFDTYDMSKQAYGAGEELGSKGPAGFFGYGSGAVAGSDFADNVATASATNKIAKAPAAVAGGLMAFLAANALLAAAMGVGLIYFLHKTGGLSSFIAQAKSASIGTAKALAGG